MNEPETIRILIRAQMIRTADGQWHVDKEHSEYADVPAAAVVAQLKPILPERQ